MPNMLGFGLRLGSQRGGGGGSAYAGASLVIDPYGANGYPFYKYVDGSTYASFAALVAASKASYSRTGAGTAFKRDGSFSQFLANVPRETNAGITIEEARTNYFLNSQAPVTQTITVNTAQGWVLNVIGSGSATVAAGTATGSGFGTATAGSPVSFTITGAGTVTVTISGSPSQVDVQQGVTVTAYALTPIITGGATAARGADSATVDGLASLLSGQFTVFVEAALTAADSQSRILLDVNDSGTTNRVTMSRDTTNNGAIIVASGGVTQANPTLPGKTGARVLKMATALTATDAICACDGVSATTSGITRPVGMNHIDLGKRFTNASYLNSPIRRVVIWPYAMTAAQLEALTT